MGHRLARDHAVALAPRRDDDDRRPLVVGADLGRAERSRPPAGAASGAAPRRRRRAAARRRPRRARARPSPRTGGRRRGRGAARRARRTESGILTPCAMTRTSRAPSARASSARAVDAQTTTRARRTSHRARGRARVASAASEPQSWSTTGFPVASAGTHARKPVRVDDVRAARRPARSAREREEEERQRERLPRRGAEVVDDAVPVGDPVVAEARRRDDAHLGPGGPQRLHAVAHERPGDVVRVARVRRRQDTDLHVPSRRRANTAGAAIASRAMT